MIVNDDAISANPNDDVMAVSPVNRLRGELRVPGDKSISHRAAMLSSLAGGDFDSGKLFIGPGLLGYACVSPGSRRAHRQEWLHPCRPGHRTFRFTTTGTTT